MKNLIQSELYKLKCSRSLKVCSIVGCVLALFVVGTFWFLSFTMNMLAEESGDPEAFNEALVAEYEAMGISEAEAAMMTGIYDGELLLSMAFSQTDLQLLLAIFISIFVAGEFSNGTIKVLVSRGYSRSQVYFSKFISGILAGNILAVIVLVASTFVGTLVFGWHDPLTGSAAGATDIILFLLVQFALNTAMSAMFVAISMMIKSLGAAIAVTIASYSFGSIIFVLLDKIVEAVAKLTEFNVADLPFLPSDIWIVQTVTNTSSLNLDSHNTILGLVVAAIYIALFTLIGMGIFCKKDIK